MGRGEVFRAFVGRWVMGWVLECGIGGWVGTGLHSWIYWLHFWEFSDGRKRSNVITYLWFL